MLYESGLSRVKIIFILQRNVVMDLVILFFNFMYLCDFELKGNILHIFCINFIFLGINLVNFIFHDIYIYIYYVYVVLVFVNSLFNSMKIITFPCIV